MPEATGKSEVLSKQLLKVDEAARVLNLSRSLMYHLVLTGQVVSFKIGGARRVPVKAITAYIDKLFALAEGA